MPNHVHLVFHLLEEKLIQQTGLSAIPTKVVPQTFQTERISKIMKTIKGYSAREANKVLNRKGNFWQVKSYYHIVRNEEELEPIIKHVTYNPVKAGLVEKWEDWEHTYLTTNWL